MASGGAILPPLDEAATYAPQSAGRHLVRRVPTARASETVAAVLERLIGQAWDVVDVVCLVDTEGVFHGVVPTKDLLAAPHSTLMGSLRAEGHYAISPHIDQERAALMAVDHEMLAVPVVDQEHRLLGVVPTETVLAILHAEHNEDFRRLAGVLDYQEQALHSATARALDLVQARIPWLLLGLAGGMLATGLVTVFEQRLAEKLALAFFMPLIVYVADAIGTQTETIFVRSLTVARLPVRTYLRREVQVGAIIGALFALLVYPIVIIVWGDGVLAAIISLSIFTTAVCAVLVATFVPWLLQRTGQDPALGGGPFATVVQDFLSLLLYFLIASMLLEMLG